MLRLWDARSGSYAVLATSPVPLRVCVHVPAGRAWSGPGDVQVLLVADVLTRIAGLQGLPTVTVLAAVSPLPDGLDEDLSALGIHRPAVAAICSESRRLICCRQPVLGSGHPFDWCP